MARSTWLEVTFYAECVGSALSITSHAILLFLVSEKTRQQIGNYKYLMIVFSVAGCFYSCCNLLNMPKVHITETSFVVFVTLSTSLFTKQLAEIALTVYCSCYAMMIGFLNLQFLYRYMSVTHPMRLKLFSGMRMSAWIVLVLIYSAAWGLISYFLDGPTETKEIELDVKLNESYGLGPGEYAFVGPQYFTLSSSSSAFSHPLRHYDIRSCVGILLLVCLLSVSVLSVAFFGVSTFRRLADLNLNSVAFKDLQQQLFRTLVFQTIIPTVFMYLPVSSMFVMPLLSLEVGASGNVVAILLAIYPSLEPIVAMVCIEDFRRRVVGIAGKTTSRCRALKRASVHSL